MIDYEIAPFRALRFELSGEERRAADLVAPPYDIITPEEHAGLLDRSPHNIVRLTLGNRPGEREGYRERGARLLEWKRQGILRPDPSPALWVYGCDYTVPGTALGARFRGLVALGRLHPFEDEVVLPHESTFAGIVDDRYRLLEATRTHLETIFVLYEDREKTIDSILEEASAGEATVSAEGRPGETHSLWPIREDATVEKLRGLFREQRPIIADGHHRYTTALRYRDQMRGDPEHGPGSDWQPVVLGNLVGDGLSILATHRLVNCHRAAEALEVLSSRLEVLDDGEERWDICVETREERRRFAIPDVLRRGREGVQASDYAILHQVILPEWLQPAVGEYGDADVLTVTYFKEGSGEREALERGDGDLLFRMRPVSPGAFRTVVEGGEVFPHKTTFFYPKLWSGLVLWSIEKV